MEKMGKAINWIPAFAGMTSQGKGIIKSTLCFSVMGSAQFRCAYITQKLLPVHVFAMVNFKPDGCFFIFPVKQYAIIPCDA
jgi:hypothetical protein